MPGWGFCLGTLPDPQSIRSGHGTKRSPYQYRLPNKDNEYYGRGELPPLEPMSEFFKRVGL